MGKQRNLTEREIGKIEAYLSLKLSQREIARRIRRSRSSVQSYIKHKSNYGKNYVGKKKFLSSKDRNILIRNASKGELNCNQLKNELNLKVSKWTIARELKGNNFQWAKMKRKPLLNRTHELKRRDFCRKNINTNWNSFWFTDEKKFCLGGPDYMNHYWHDLKREKLQAFRSQKHKQGISIWGGISFTGKTELAFLDENCNSKKYQEVLNEYLLPQFKENDVLIQDNAPFHVSKCTRQWMNDKKINAVAFPPCSPDFNPIENVWGLLVRRIYSPGVQFSSKNELKKSVINKWRQIDQEYIKRLFQSMNDRLYDCIERKGASTKY